MLKQTRKVKNNKSAIRMCVVCRSHRPKNEMLRFIQVDNVLFFDEKGGSGGRGVNVCSQISCVDSFFKSQLFRKHWPDVQMSAQSLDEVKEKARSYIENRDFRKGERNIVLRISKDVAEAQIGSSVTRIS